MEGSCQEIKTVGKFASVCEHVGGFLGGENEGQEER